MIKVAAVTMLVGLVMANQEVREYQQPGATFAEPKFCNKLDCPKYSVVKDYGSFEERRYEKSMWVTTSMTGIEYEQAQYRMFMKLFRYIQGANVKKEKIAMTAPVKTRIIPGQGQACESNFTMSFFVSSEMASPPQPTDNTIRIEEVPAETFYVISFGGFTWSFDKWSVEATKLKEALDEQKLTNFQTDFYYISGYDSPYRLFNRHNEVWFTEVPSLQSPQEPSQQGTQSKPIA